MTVTTTTRIPTSGAKPKPESEYHCSECGKPILDHVYRVQRRSIRPVISKEKGGIGSHDAVHTWHDGVKVGPESDDYCPDCYKLLPDIQELLSDYHKSLNRGST